MRNGIAAVLIVKDEEQLLDRCLKSLEGVDQIVVLDTGSIDKTIEIAKMHTDDVFTTEPIVPFHFAEARNRALKHVRQDWVITIDADEVLTPPSLAQIRKALWRQPAAAGFNVNFVLYDEEGKNPGRLPKLKVFRLGLWEWRYRVHETLFPLGTDVFAKNLPQAVIEHRPIAGKDARRGQNLELLKLAIDENPEYIRNVRQLGMEFYSRRQWAKAIPHLETYLKSNQVDRLDRSETLIHVALCLAMLAQYEEAVTRFDEAEKIAPDRREVLYHRGVALIKGCYLDQAVEALEKCLTIPVSSKPDFHLNVEGVWDGSAVHEALDFAKTQIAQAKAKWAAQQAKAGPQQP